MQIQEDFRKDQLASDCRLMRDMLRCIEQFDFRTHQLRRCRKLLHWLMCTPEFNLNSDGITSFLLQCTDRLLYSPEGRRILGVQTVMPPPKPRPSAMVVPCLLRTVPIDELEEMTIEDHWPLDWRGSEIPFLLSWIVFMIFFSFRTLDVHDVLCKSFVLQ